MLLAGYGSGDFEGAEKNVLSYLRNMYNNADQTTRGYSLEDYKDSTDIGRNVAAVLGFAAAWENATSNKEDVWYKQFEAVKALRKTLYSGYDYQEDMPQKTMDAMNKLLVSLGLKHDPEGNVFSLTNEVFKDMPYKGYFESVDQEGLHKSIAQLADVAIRELDMPWIKNLYDQMMRTLQNNDYFKALRTPFIGEGDVDETIKTAKGTFRYVPSENRYIKDNYVVKSDIAGGRFVVKNPAAAKKKGNYYDYQEGQREAQKYLQRENNEIIEDYQDDEIPSLYSWNKPWNGAVGNPLDFQSATQRQISGIAEKPTYATNTVTYQPGAYQININGVPLSVSEAKEYSEPIAQIGHYLLGVAGVEDRTLS